MQRVTIPQRISLDFLLLYHERLDSHWLLMPLFRSWSDQTYGRFTGKTHAPCEGRSSPEAIPREGNNIALLGSLFLNSLRVYINFCNKNCLKLYSTTIFGWKHFSESYFDSSHSLKTVRYVINEFREKKLLDERQ